MSGPLENGLREPGGRPLLVASIWKARAHVNRVEIDRGTEAFPSDTFSNARVGVQIRFMQVSQRNGMLVSLDSTCSLDAEIDDIEITSLGIFEL
jgi:hypothetical protein